MSTPSAGTMMVPCPCGAKLKVPASAAGKKARCPKCHNTVTIPPSVPAAPEPEDDGNALLEALAREERTATAVAESDSRRVVNCPECGATMAANAVLCVGCGYNRDSGRKVKAAAGKKSAAASAVKHAATGLGTFFLGCVLSAAGALLGGLIWLAVAMILMVEIGWIAWGLGALAGGGMYLGYKGANARAGLTASLIAVAGILAAKLAVFVFVLVTVMGGPPKSDTAMRRDLAKGIANQDLDERGATNPAIRQALWPRALKDAEVRVSNMSGYEVEQKTKELKEYEKKRSEMFDPTGSKRERVAMIMAARHSDRDGLSPDHNRRWIHQGQERDRLKAMTDDAFKTEFENFQKWEKEGKWSDAEYLRDRAIYLHIDEAVAEREAKGRPYPRPYPEHEWNTLYRNGKAKAEAMTIDQQKDFVAKADRALEEEAMRDRLADHRLHTRSMAQGLSEFDPRYDVLDDEIRAECAKMTGKELDTAVAELDKWESGGHDADPKYVRDRLVYAFIEQEEIAKTREVLQRDSTIDDESAGARKEPTRIVGEESDLFSAEQWKKSYDKATARADAVPPDQRTQRWKELETESAAALDAEASAMFREAVQEAASELGNTFFATMFRPMDAIFLLLAVATAWRIASGGN